MIPDDRKYAKSHEWVKQEGDLVTIGITDFAVHELCSGNVGDLVYCDLPTVGRILETSETFGEIESVKAVADLNAPVAGEVAQVNLAIEEHLEILSQDPYKLGWLVKLKPIDLNMDADHLLDAKAYEAFLATQES